MKILLQDKNWKQSLIRLINFFSTQDYTTGNCVVLLIFKEPKSLFKNKLINRHQLTSPHFFQMFQHILKCRMKYFIYQTQPSMMVGITHFKYL